MLSSSALHEQLVEPGLGRLNGLLTADRMHLDPRNRWQLFTLVASHIDQNEFNAVLHAADIVGQRKEGLEGGEVELELREVQFYRLLQWAEVAVLFAEAEGEVLLETYLKRPNEEEVKLIYLFEQVAGPLERGPLLEDSVLPEENDERGRRGLAQQQGAMVRRLVHFDSVE